jgi:hypothetical protein
MPFFNTSFKNTEASELEELRDSFKYIQNFARRLETGQIRGTAVIEVGQFIDQGVSKEVIAETTNAQGLETKTLQHHDVRNLYPMQSCQRFENRRSHGGQLRELLRLFLTSGGK